MNNTSAKKTLKIYSEIFIILALIDIVKAISSCIDGDFIVDNIAYAFNVSNSVALATIIIAIVLTAIVFLIELYLGVKGIGRADSNSPAKNKFHITLAKIVLVPVVLVLIMQAYSLFMEISTARFIDWLDLATPLASACIVFGYISSAKAVEAEYENKQILQK